MVKFTKEIKEELLNRINFSAELAVVDNSGLFHIDGSKYKYIGKYLGLDSLINGDEAKDNFIHDYSFGYTFGDYSDYITVNDFAYTITAEMDIDMDSDVYDKLIDIIEAEETALEKDLVEQLKKLIEFYCNLKGDIEDSVCLDDVDPENKGYISDELIDMEVL